MTTEEFYNRFEFDPSMSGSLLGRGGFSSVHKVYDKVRKRYVAVKRCEVGAFQKFDLEREVKLAHEIDIHPNIIRYENVYRITDRAGAYDYAIMKYYAEGNLDDVLRKHDLNDDAKRQILTGILEGLAHLHQVPIIHRDFKTANILMDRGENGSWIPIIADFGLSRLVDTEMSYVLNNSQIAHTPSYAAPEQLLDNGTIRPNTDLWAFGVMTYKMVMGRLPFRVEGTTGDWDASNKIRSLILEGKLPADISTVQEPYKSIIRQCLVSDPNKRVKKAEDVLKLLERPTAQTPPPPPASSASFDGKTKIYAEPKRAGEVPVPPSPVKEKENPPVIKRFAWEMVLLICSIVFVGGIFYWLATRPGKEPVKLTTQAVTATDTLIKETKDSIAVGTTVGWDKKKDQEITQHVKPEKQTKKPGVIQNAKVGYLDIYTMHDMRVYIDNKLQPKEALSGFKNEYELPVGEGIFLKVIRKDLELGRTEILTVRPGKTLVRKYDIDN